MMPLSVIIGVQPSGGVLIPPKKQPVPIQEGISRLHSNTDSFTASLAEPRSGINYKRIKQVVGIPVTIGLGFLSVFLSNLPPKLTKLKPTENLPAITAALERSLFCSKAGDKVRLLAEGRMENTVLGSQNPELPISRQLERCEEARKTLINKLISTGTITNPENPTLTIGYTKKEGKNVLALQKGWFKQVEMSQPR
jgi:hypothetical protein